MPGGDVGLELASRVAAAVEAALGVRITAEEATDILREVLKQADVDYHIQFLPWPRALLNVKQEPNTLIYTISRTPERESQYEWIGPFAKHQGFFYKLASRKDIRVETLQDVRRYRVATVRGDAQTDLMLKLGVALNGTEQKELACRTFFTLEKRFLDLSAAFKQRLAEEKSKAQCPV